MENSIQRVHDIYQLFIQKQQPVAIAKKLKGEWVKYSTEEFKQNVDALSLGFLALDIKPQDKVAIVSYNRPEWLFVDIALQRIGAVSVPIYSTITIEDYAYIFADAGVKIAFVETQEIADKVKAATKTLGYDINFYSFDKLENEKHWSEVKELGKNGDLAKVEQLAKAVQSSDLLTLIYTSGTTGKPKGVMLSHSNLVSNVTNAIHLMPVDSGEPVLSFLPMCHVFERMLMYIYLLKGVNIWYVESMETIGDNLKEVKPAMFTTVPRLLEKVYDRIMDKASTLTGIKKFLFYWALGLGQKYKLNTNQGFWYNIQLTLANKIIFNKWREALGGNVKTIVSGSAPLQPRLATVFWAAQMPIMEGYGLTETSPVISVNEVSAENNRIGTVGKIIKGIELKFAEDGEILVKGPNVMMGYYNKPEATDEVIKDGWFHTGDIGELIEGQFLKITDRKKEMFKTSGGKYVAPSLLENKFKESPIIEQIMIVGDGEKFPGALIVPNFEALKKYCLHKKIYYTSDAEIIKNPTILDKYNRIIEEKNVHFAQYEKVKKIKLLPKLWTIDSGELTPKLSLKRKVIKEKYLKEINEIYGHEQM
jgi:long-chain acyl-CoA synthetase